MTLGGRRVEVSRPRIRSADDERELPVETYGYFADRDPLTVVVMNRMLAGVSTRKYAAVGEPVGAEVERESRSTSKSTRRIIGYRDLATLGIAIERHAARTAQRPSTATVTHTQAPEAVTV